jgi:thioredoxin-like negative regulator of GroEL
MAIARTVPAILAVLVSSSVILVTPASASGQDELARAKELYASAAYDDALAALSNYRGAGGDLIEVDEYRAFCLLAVGKTEDAGKVIEQIIARHPSFQPSEAQASPRIQEAFRRVRRRVLPALVRRAYNEAKETFDRKEFATAAKQFDQVIALINDADGADSGDLVDLRTLSKGFADLIKTMPAAAPEPAKIQSKATAPIEAIYSTRDVDVSPPVPILQRMPPWHPMIGDDGPYEATLMLIIDETGNVASATLIGSLRPSYDALLREVAPRWKYRPAMKNGRPVKFQKVIAIRLNATPR